MVLHHLGESTLSDIKDVEKECVAAGAKTIVVAGDISNPTTAQDVSILSTNIFYPNNAFHLVARILRPCPAKSPLTTRSYPPLYPPSPA